MKTYLPQLSLLALAAASLSLTAQTASHPSSHPPVHHTATAMHHVEGGCVKLPELSPKIPAVPVGSPCAKSLYTLTRTPDLKLDYVSPLVSTEVRAVLSAAPTTFSLDYIDTEIGTGALALPHKWYTVHYTGYLPNGTKFDSSVDRGEPISFPYGQHRVIEGWDTGFEGMHVGSKRRLFVPYQLAYGDAGRPPVIPAKSELVFDVELIAQSDEEPKPTPRPRPTPPPTGGEPNAHQPAPSAGSGTNAPVTPSRPNTPINTETPNAKAPTPK
jgi:peptidylprolyl isomerase